MRTLWNTAFCVGRSKSGGVVTFTAESSSSRPMKHIILTRSVDPVLPGLRERFC